MSLSSSLEFAKNLTDDSRHSKIRFVYAPVAFDRGDGYWVVVSDSREAIVLLSNVLESILSFVKIHFPSHQTPEEKKTLKGVSRTNGLGLLNGRLG